ncbi:MAG: flavodoxin domain-containing protein [Clostridium sp.]|uniref:flavodoxin domain-containing protein n=1 Tax=Clostridium culturomicium TaxID=1499683 RepID=UPI00058D956B|nr:flavodoxin domain-containing protein [Clostridium culturomicium]MDU4889150.1 flavodoxin domain-containing protein [Clostridium sp.]MDU7083206.1 flavodoxin domain-containing protein [Clostridium sp.]
MCRMVVVACKSRYAHTKTYAQWIAAEFGADLIECCNVDIETLLNYDIIVYGGGIYNHAIEGISTITKNFDLLKNKTIVVFTVGMECSSTNGDIMPFIEKSFTDEMKEKIHLFHLKGESDHIKNGFLHNQLWGIFKKLISHKCPDYFDGNEPIVLSSYGNVIDFIDKHALDPSLAE